MWRNLGKSALRAHNSDNQAAPENVTMSQTVHYAAQKRIDRRLAALQTKMPGQARHFTFMFYLSRSGNHKLPSRGSASPLVSHQLKTHFLAIIQAFQSGAFYCRNMHKYIFATVIGLDEPKSLLCVEPFHSTTGHQVKSFSCVTYRQLVAMEQAAKSRPIIEWAEYETEILPNQEPLPSIIPNFSRLSYTYEKS
jgi:hypothetical protein